MTFFICHHEFKPGMGPKFLEWLRNLNDEDWAAIAERNLSAGMWNHSIDVTGPNSPVYCIWESNRDMTVEQFRQFMEGPNGPDVKWFHNNPYKCEDGFKPPYPSHFDHEGETTPRLNKFPRLKKLLKETGSSDAGVVFQRPLNNSNFFMVHHTFVDAQAADAFYAWNASMNPEKWKKQWDKNLSEGMWNHSFIATGKNGPVFCLWESKNNTGVAGVNKFIEGPNFACPGMFNQTVHPLLHGYPEPYHSKFEGATTISRG